MIEIFGFMEKIIVMYCLVVNSNEERVVVNCLIIYIKLIVGYKEFIMLMKV